MATPPVTAASDSPKPPPLHTDPPSSAARPPAGAAESANQQPSPAAVALASVAVPTSNIQAQDPLSSSSSSPSPHAPLPCSAAPPVAAPQKGGLVDLTATPPHGAAAPSSTSGGTSAPATGKSTASSKGSGLSNFVSRLRFPGMAKVGPTASSTATAGTASKVEPVAAAPVAAATPPIPSASKTSKAKKSGGAKSTDGPVAVPTSGGAAEGASSTSGSGSLLTADGAGAQMTNKDGLKAYFKKFDVDEIAVLKKVYRELCERSSGPSGGDKSHGIDKQTFLQYFPYPGMWGERMFRKFDYKNKGHVDYEEFLVGIAICCRGTKCEKIRVLFELFDLNNDDLLSRDELIAMLASIPDLKGFMSCNDGKDANDTRPRLATQQSRQLATTVAPINPPPVNPPALVVVPAVPPTESPSLLAPPQEEAEVEGGTGADDFEYDDYDDDDDDYDDDDYDDFGQPVAPSVPGEQSQSLFDAQSERHLSTSSLIAPQSSVCQPATAAVRNPSRMGQQLIDKEISEASAEPDFSVEALVDKILEDCESENDGALTQMEFKTWLEHHENILELFTSTLHEEVWGLQGQALYRSQHAAGGKHGMVAANRHPSAASLVSNGNRGPQQTISPQTAEKIRFLFNQPADASPPDVGSAPLRAVPSKAVVNPCCSASAASELEEQERLSEQRQMTLADDASVYISHHAHGVAADHRASSEQLAPECGSYSFPTDGRTRGGSGAAHSSPSSRGASESPLRNTDVVLQGSELGTFGSAPLEAVPPFVEYWGGAFVAELKEENIEMLNLHAHEILSCPKCSALLLVCQRCGRHHPQLKIATTVAIESPIVTIECEACEDGKPFQFESCWHCEWNFSKAQELLEVQSLVPSCEGVLYKEGKNGVLRSGHYVLIENHLYHYFKREDPKPKGFHFLGGCYVEPVEDDESAPTSLNAAGGSQKASNASLLPTAVPSAASSGASPNTQKKNGATSSPLPPANGCAESAGGSCSGPEMAEVVDPKGGEGLPPREKFGFSIAHSGSTTYRRVFFAKSKEERTVWLEALRKAMKQQSIEHLYEFGEQIGQGKFSVVYNAISKLTNEEVAIKAVGKKRLSPHERELLRSEMSVVRLLRHNHIVRLQEVLDSKDTLHIVMEYVKGGELFDLLRTQRMLPELQVNRIIRQLLQTVSYLHKCGIIHRDLKPENILLTDQGEDGDIKLTDFGLSCICAPHDVLHQPCGTLAYVAPEVLSTRGYSHKADVWSIGVIMHLLLSGHLPFHVCRSPPPARSAEIDERYSRLAFTAPIWKEISSSAKDFLKKLLNPEPSLRISVEDALQQLWIKNPTAVINEAPGATDETEGAGDSGDRPAGTGECIPETLLDVSASTFTIATSEIPVTAPHQ